MIYPPVEVRLVDGPVTTFDVVQANAFICSCQSELHALLIAELLNRWFNEKADKAEGQAP